MKDVDLKKLATEVRARILRMHHRANSSHIASSFSSLEILLALYFRVLRIKPEEPTSPDRDRLILSKGHACSALYAVLAERGFFDRSLLEGYCLDKGLLPGHATMSCVPGVEVSTGSLGHGLPMGVGMALAARHDGRASRIFVLMSDGECEEGSVWESAMFASHRKLDNVTAIIDRNMLQAFGRTADVTGLEPLRSKWDSFGWETAEVGGHDIGALEKVLRRVPLKSGKPSVIIARTTKGKGVSFMENKLEWHYRSPSAEDLDSALRELGQ